METLDRTLVAIGRVIGKPPGWERTVRRLAPPARYAGGPIRSMTAPERYVFPVDRGTLIGWAIHFFGSYEPEVRFEIKRRLPSGGTAIDVGANVGWHTLLMAVTAGPSGRVFAFEPNGSTRRRLQDAIAANGFPHVDVDSRAVADRSGLLGFSAPDAGQFWDGTGRLVADADTAHARVSSVTLDDFIVERRLARVDLIKIDVEGWELSVLRGARRLLTTLRPVVIFEHDPAYVTRSGGSGAELADFLSDAGYRIMVLGPKRPPRAVGHLAGGVSGNLLALPSEAVVRS